MANYSKSITIQKTLLTISIPMKASLRHKQNLTDYDHNLSLFLSNPNFSRVCRYSYIFAQGFLFSILLLLPCLICYWKLHKMTQHGTEFLSKQISLLDFFSEHQMTTSLGVTAWFCCSPELFLSRYPLIEHLVKVLTKGVNCLLEAIYVLIQLVIWP